MLVTSSRVSALIGVTGDQVGEGLAVAADRCPHAANNLQARAAAMAERDRASPDALQEAAMAT